MFVVDANVVFSALIKRGIAYKVFFLNFLLEKFRFIAPEYLWLEIRRHKEEILEETKLSEEEFEEFFEFLMEEIEIVPDSKFLHVMPKAEEILPEHKKDSPYLALALAMNCPIFSGDVNLKKQTVVKVYSPRELLDTLLGEASL